MIIVLFFFSGNVIWLDNITAARALYGLSKKINGFELLDEDNPFIDDAPSEKPPPTSEEPQKESTKGRSILLINKDNPQADDPTQFKHTDEAWESQEPVDLIDISVPIPPGFWRLGKPHSKAKTILFRFAFKTDRKAFKAEKLSEYYKKHGNPNFGGMKGLISESRKRLMKFGGNREVRLTSKDFVDEGDSKNPWGTLAQNWNNEDRGVASIEPKEIVAPKPVIERVILTSTGKSIQDRIGSKRSVNDDSDGSVEEVKRKKMPRMRMYADEEQDRLNRLKALKKLATVSKTIENSVDVNSDLRTRLMQSDRKKLVQPNQPAKPTLLPDLTIRIPQTLPVKKLNRFENRLGEKVVRMDEEIENGGRKSAKERISEKVTYLSGNF